MSLTVASLMTINELEHYLKDELNEWSKNE